jgi:hypothetical protein
MFNLEARTGLVHACDMCVCEYVSQLFVILKLVGTHWLLVHTSWCTSSASR